MARVGIIIPQSKVSAANKWMKNRIDTLGGEHSFTSPLSATGSLPVTHRVCYWRRFDASQKAAFEAELGVTGVPVLKAKIETKVDGQVYINMKPKDMFDTSGLYPIVTDE